MHVDIREIRRARLKEWFSRNPIPSDEKSYISQLLRGGSAFGERAARRLEQTYKMGDRYLDREEPAGNVVSMPQMQVSEPQAGTSYASPQILQRAIYLLQLFNNADERVQHDMIRMAELLSGRNGNGREAADPVGNES